jgi:hypothetical protein
MKLGTAGGAIGAAFDSEILVVVLVLGLEPGSVATRP